jgi:hypothetical protein
MIEGGLDDMRAKQATYAVPHDAERARALARNLDRDSIAAPVRKLPS